MQVPIYFGKKRDWLVSISGFFDESGKFKDRDVIAFGGVAAQTILFDQYFAEEWRFLLNVCGLESLTVKEAFNVRRPLSDKLPALGIDERIKALLPFILCVRKPCK